MNTPNIDRLGVYAVAQFFDTYGWIFREQFVYDFGVDAQVEIKNDERATGDLISIQIKSGHSYFLESNDEWIVFRVDNNHVEYWLGHSLPVIVVLYQPENKICYWEYISNKTVINTGKNWKVNISTDKKLTESCLEELCKISRLHIEKRWLQLSVKSYDDIPQELFDTFFAEFVEKNIGLLERESLIVKLIEKYKELEAQLASRTDDIGQQAKVLLNEGKLEEADKLFEQALENDLKIAKEANLKAAANAFSLAQIKSLRLDYQTAKNYYQQATQLDPNNALYLNDLAAHFYTLGEYDNASRFYQHALEMYGEDSLEVSVVLNNLAIIYKMQGNYVDARLLYKRSLKIDKKTHGKDSPEVATVLNNLALLCKTQGNHAAAERLYKRSLTIREETLDKNHLDIAQSLNNLATLYQTQGNYLTAESLCLRSLEIKKNNLGENHPNVAISLNNLATLYYLQGKYKEAETLMQRALAIFEKSLGTNHPNTKTVRDNLEALQAAKK